MLRYRLRTLLILLAILPPLLWVGWGEYEAWRSERERASQSAVFTSGLKQIRISIHEYHDQTTAASPAVPEEREAR